MGLLEIFKVFLWKIIQLIAHKNSVKLKLISSVTLRFRRVDVLIKYIIHYIKQNTCNIHIEIMVLQCSQ